MDRQCQCTSHSQLSLAEYLVLDAQQKRGGKYLKATTFHSCWYGTNRLDEMIAESNALFRLRNSWVVHARAAGYPGHTECPVTTNIDTPEYLDAIVIQLPPVSESHTHIQSNNLNNVNVSACDFDEPPYYKTKYNVRHLHNLYGPLPVMFLAQVRGIQDNATCQKYWKGQDCDTGYRKFFFAQSYNFSDGSCLAKPPDCQDVYFHANCTNITTPVGCRQRSKSRAVNFFFFSD
jgi:hypothetical protein